MTGGRNLKAWLFTSIFLLGILCTAASGRTIYVDNVGSADFSTIQAAINDANDGDTIIVADGIFTGEGNRDIDFLGKEITVRSENGPENCIIDCNGTETENHRGFHFHNGEDSNSVLEGFTITNGYADGNTGGGIYCSYSSPTITNCIIRGNVAPVIRVPGGVLVFNNGAGIGCYKSSPTIRNCYIVANIATGAGAGISFLHCDNPEIRNCVIAGNIALHEDYGRGGAIYSSSSSPKISNCTITGNLAGASGGGIYCVYGGSPTITNSIFWANLHIEIYVSTGAPATPVVTYTNIRGSWPGERNIDVDPWFFEPGYWDPNENPTDPNDDFWVEGDYHLLRDSPCIDVGDPNYVLGPNETDLCGMPRLLDGNKDGLAIVDMGAYEYKHSIAVEVKIVPRAFNLASKGKWIAAFLWLPEDYNVADIDPNSLLLEYTIEPERFWFNEEKQIALARFDRSDVQDILDIGQVELVISGRLLDATIFEGTDIIRVIDKSGGKSAK